MLTLRCTADTPKFRPGKMSQPSLKTKFSHKVIALTAFAKTKGGGGGLGARGEGGVAYKDWARSPPSLSDFGNARSISHFHTFSTTRFVPGSRQSPNQSRRAQAAPSPPAWEYQWGTGKLAAIRSPALRDGLKAEGRGRAPPTTRACAFCRMAQPGRPTPLPRPAPGRGMQMLVQARTPCGGWWRQNNSSQNAKLCGDVAIGPSRCDKRSLVEGSVS